MTRTRPALMDLPQRRQDGSSGCDVAVLHTIGPDDRRVGRPDGRR
ncbi:hypothetical protein [Leekyejoonella antrihumi]|nr:hypothetical protein [Leekyejoonella antrihumi]